MTSSAAQVELRDRVGGPAAIVDPVALIVIAGALTIALKATQSPRSSHAYWLTFVLAESAVALLLRKRHPTVALAGVLAAYLIFDFPAISAAPVLVALFTVAIVNSAAKTEAAAAVTAPLAIVATPLPQRGLANIAPPAFMLAAIVAVAGLGARIRRAVR